MKVYIERNNVQGELVRFRKKYRHYSRLLLRSEEFKAIALTEHNSRQLLSDDVYCHLSAAAPLRHDLFHHSIEWCAGVFLSTIVFTQFNTLLRYADKRNVYGGVYRKEQLATRINVMQPTERISGRLEHKPLRLRFGQSS